MSNRPCRFGLRCYRADCMFRHPPGWAHEVDDTTDDDDDDDCTCPECHKVLKSPAAMQQHRRDAHCCYACESEEEESEEEESEEEESEEVATCHYGRGCNNRTCSFAHPDGRSIDDGLCKQGCGRKVRAGTTSNGHVWTTCCKGCVQSGEHDATCKPCAGETNYTGTKGRVFSMYHGTSLAAWNAIQREGFRPSTCGCLGPGVYCSRDRDKAANYRSGDDGVIIRLRVDLGKGIKIREQGHDLQKSWHDHGFDSAWAPAGAIGQLEENCVFDPKRITILGLA